MAEKEQLEKALDLIDEAIEILSDDYNIPTNTEIPIKKINEAKFILNVLINNNEKM